MLINPLLLNRPTDFTICTSLNKLVDSFSEDATVLMLHSVYHGGLFLTIHNPDNMEAVNLLVSKVVVVNNRYKLGIKSTTNKIFLRPIDEYVRLQSYSNIEYITLSTSDIQFIKDTMATKRALKLLTL